MQSARAVTGRRIMTRLSVMHPNTPEADRGLAGGAPGSPGDSVGMCQIFCDSVGSFQGTTLRDHLRQED